MQKTRSVIFILLVLLTTLQLTANTDDYLKNIDSLDKGGRWLSIGIKEINQMNDLTDETKNMIGNHLIDLIINKEDRFNISLQNTFIKKLKQMEVENKAIKSVERTHLRVNSPLNLHDGYWVTKIKIPKTFMKLTIVNDIHVDVATNLITVYAQSQISGKIIVPAQIKPGETTELPNGDIIESHPGAVYLNGSGKELSKADETGSWWVKNSWVLGGKGYYSWDLKPSKAYGDGILMHGILLEDGLSIKIEPSNIKDGIYEIRKPTFKGKKISYLTTRYTSTGQRDIKWSLKTTKSSFDNLARKPQWP